MTADTDGMLHDGPEAEHLRATERARLRALVEANVEAGASAARGRLPAHHALRRDALKR